MADKYNNLRKDGSTGQLENIGVDYPIDGVKYTGQVTRFTNALPVDIIIAFTGIDD